VLQELMGLMAGGIPDPVKLTRLLTQNPALKKMVEQFAPGMGLEMPNMGDMGGGGGPANARARSQREKLQERLRQKREAGEVNIPEVKASGKDKSAMSAIAASEEDDDWGIPATTSTSSGGSKKKNNKKKGGKKK
jgi:hypothetical protein